MSHFKRIPRDIFAYCALKASFVPSRSDHVPDVSTWDGVQDIILFCIIIELLEIIHPINPNGLEHVRVVDAARQSSYRKSARVLVEYLDRTVQLVDQNQPDELLYVTTDLYEPYFTQVVKVIAKNKKGNARKLIEELLQGQANIEDFKTWYEQITEHTTFSWGRPFAVKPIETFNCKCFELGF